MTVLEAFRPGSLFGTSRFTPLTRMNTGPVVLAQTFRHFAGRTVQEAARSHVSPLVTFAPAKDGFEEMTTL